MEPTACIFAKCGIDLSTSIMATYSKYSTSIDRWICWDSDTGESFMMTPEDKRQHFGLTKKQEYFRRFGVWSGESDEELVELYETPTFTLNRETGKVEKSYTHTLDKKTETNPALYWPGENTDAAAGRFYGRPVPASAGPLPRPA